MIQIPGDKAVLLFGFWQIFPLFIIRTAKKYSKNIIKCTAYSIQHFSQHFSQFLIHSQLAF